MKIESGEIAIKITIDDAYDLACCINNYLNHSIVNHYNQLQQNQDGESVFFDHKGNYIHMAKMLYGASGYDSIHEYNIQEYKHMFAQKRKERSEADNVHD